MNVINDLDFPRQLGHRRGKGLERNDFYFPKQNGVEAGGSGGMGTKGAACLAKKWVSCGEI